MEIRKRAELDVLYPEAQQGMKYDSPELLLIRIDGTLPVRQNADYLVSLLAQETGSGR